MPAKILCTSDEESELRRGPWTLEEDNLLVNYISGHGEGRWNHLAKCAGLKRTGKSCRLRWLNYLKPDVKRGNLTPQEQLMILELHSKWGNRWSKIAQQLPGRTDNEIKNYWRTRVQKQARQLNIDTNSETFLNAVRCFWMPNMVQSYTNRADSSQFTIPYSLNSYTEIPSSLLPSNQNQFLQIPIFDDSSTPATMDHFSEQQPPSPYAMDNIFYKHPFFDCNNNSLMADNSSYEMECYNPAMENVMQIQEGNRGMSESLPTWNMDDYWPFM